MIHPLKLVFWCLAMIGAATNIDALSASSLQNDQNTKSITSLLLQSMGSLRNIICFYCPLSCLKWIDTIYELKINAVWWSVPQKVSFDRVLRRYSLTILSIYKYASFMYKMTRTFTLLTVKHCELMKCVVFGYRARKSRTTLQNKVRLKVLPEQLTLFVNMSVTFKNCIIQ